MKYVVFLGDGMADRPLPQRDNKTPLELANKPFIDFLAQKGELGLVKTVPNGLKPGSDVCNLSVMGYDPAIYYTGRSSIEAVSIGIKLNPTDVTFRCNLVTLSNEDNLIDKTMIDYSSGEISTEEATELINALKKEFDSENYSLYSGISYRHCLVSFTQNKSAELTPPHDITGKPIKDYLPKNDLDLLKMIEKSNEILKNHPVNLERIKKGKRPATHCWFWGMGTAPSIPDFFEKNKIKGAVISAVDLVKGIGILGNMENINVPGATGDIDTNFEGKAEYALKSLETNDFVYIHMEAPDECGHRGEIDNKIKSIELIDQLVVKKVVEGLETKNEEFTILVIPDHPTPIEIKTHASEPVPYLFYSNVKNNCTNSSLYSEKEASLTNVYVENGYTIIDKLINYAK